MTHDKNHWYDGWFYDKMIAPNQDRIFREIKKVIEPNSTIIDVGCGTGRFSFSIADKVNSVAGIDFQVRILKRQIKRFKKIQIIKFHFFIQILQI